MRTSIWLWACVMLLGISGSVGAQGTSANLGNLGFAWSDGTTGGPVDLGFEPSTTEYTARVPPTIALGLLEWAAEDSLARVKLNGVDVTSADSQPLSITSADLPLTLNLEVNSEDGNTTKTYVVTVEEEASDNATVVQVDVFPGVQISAFDPTGVQRLRVRVPKAQADVSVTATAEDSTASLSVAGQSVLSGVTVEGIAVPLFEPAVNEIAIVATAQDGVTTRDYAIEVVRERSTDASLVSLVNVDAAYPVVQDGPTTWSVALPLDVPSLSIVPTATDSDASLQIVVGDAPPAAASTGEPFGPIEVPVQGVDVFVLVTSQDGSAMRAHTLNIRRVIDPALRLVAFETTGFCCPTTSNLEGPFQAIALPAASTVDVKFVLADPTSTMSLGGESLANDTFRTISVATPYPSQAPLELPLRIRKADGSAEVELTLFIIRDPSNDAGLSEVGVVGGEINPAFHPITVRYDVRGALGEPVTFTPTLRDPRARIVFVSTALPEPVAVPSGGTTPPIVLSSQATGVGFQVTAESGAEQLYIFSLIGRSATNSLVAAQPSDGRLIPFFDVDVLDYELRVPSAATTQRLRLVAMDPTSTIRVNGELVASGQESQPIDVTGTPDPIAVQVTSELGGVRTYRFTVARNVPPEIDVQSSAALREDGELVVPVDLRDMDDVAEALIVDAATDNPQLFDIGPIINAIRLGGSVRPLRLAPQRDQWGTATITLTVGDPVGDTRSVAIEVEVTPVNDAPTFELTRLNLQAEPRATAVTASGLLANVRAGPPDEADQQLTAFASVRTASGGVQVDSLGFDLATGTLDLALNGQPGALLVDLMLQDDGGTADGGRDTSDPKTVLVNVPSSPDAVDLSVLIRRTGASGNGRSYEFVVSNFGPASANGARLYFQDAEGMEALHYSCFTAGGATCVLGEEEGQKIATMDLPNGGTINLLFDGVIRPGASFIQIQGEVRAEAGTVVDNPTDDRAMLIEAVGDGIVRDGFESR